jgi:hypothetical protein
MYQCRLCDCVTALIWIAAQGTGMSKAAQHTVKTILREYNYDPSQFEDVSWEQCPEPE